MNFVKLNWIQTWLDHVFVDFDEKLVDVFVYVECQIVQSQPGRIVTLFLYTNHYFLNLPVVVIFPSFNSFLGYVQSLVDRKYFRTYRCSYE